MKAMVIETIGRIGDAGALLKPVNMPKPACGPADVLIRVSVCGVCHTELDEIEGRAEPPRLPVVPGHQVVGRIEAVGREVQGPKPGDRVGVAWIFSACGHCAYCTSGRENLCAEFCATGRDIDGGYAEYMRAPAAFVHPVPDGLDDVAAAPLLCAGAVGYRAVRLTRLQDGEAIGLTGFGASAHLVLQLIRHRFPASRVHVFARSPDQRARALQLGATWAGDTSDMPPEALDAIIDTTPAWRPVAAALTALKPGGRLVVNAIRKEEADKAALLDLDYGRDLWMEKAIQSVANVTRADVREFLDWAAQGHVQPQTVTYPLSEANTALRDLKAGRVPGAAVLIVGG